MTDRDLIRIAREAKCTPQQLEALELAAKGYGCRRIGRILQISPQAAAARLEGARRRIKRHRKEAA